MAPVMPNTNSLEVAELEAVFRILERSLSIRPDPVNPKEALDRFLRVYEIVNTATHRGVEEARAKLEKK